MGPVQEKQVGSCFGRCKVNLQTLAYPLLSFSAPTAECFRTPSAPPPPRSGSALSAGASTWLRTLPSPSEPRAQPAPSRAECHRAEPHRLFLPRLGAVHHSQRLKPHPAPVAWASTRLSPPLQITAFRSFETFPFGRKGRRCLHLPTCKGSRQMQHAPCCKEQFPRPRLPIYLGCTSSREAPGQITHGSEGCGEPRGPLQRKLQGALKQK